MDANVVGGLFPDTAKPNSGGLPEGAVTGVPGQVAVFSATHAVGGSPKVTAAGASLYLGDWNTTPGLYLQGYSYATVDFRVGGNPGFDFGYTGTVFNLNDTGVDSPIAITKGTGGQIVVGGNSRPVVLPLGSSLSQGSIVRLTVGGGFVGTSLVISGQTTLATALNGVLKASAGVVGLAGPGDLPGGPYQPLEDQRLSTTNNVGFNDLALNGNLNVTVGTSYLRIVNVGWGSVGSGILMMRASNTGTSWTDIQFFGGATTQLRSVLRWSDPADALVVMTRNDDGSVRDDKLVIPRSSSLPISTPGGFSASSLTATSATASTMAKWNASKSLVSAVAGTDYLAPANVSGVVNQIAGFTGTNAVGGDVGLTRLLSSSKTVELNIGDGATSASVGLTVNGLPANHKYIVFRDTGVNRWIVRSVASTADFSVDAYATGAIIDSPIVVGNASGSAITLGGSGRPVNLTSGSKLTQNGSDRITVGGGFVGTSIQISGATASTMAKWDAGKNLVSAVAGTDYLAPANVSGVVDQVATFSATNTVGGDTGLTVTRTAGITRTLSIGLPGVGTHTNSAYLKLYAGNSGSNQGMVGAFLDGVERVDYGMNATASFDVIMLDSAGAVIDIPLTIANASAGVITLGGSTNRPVQTSSILTVGANTTAATAAVIVNGPANQSKLLSFRNAGVGRWSLASVATSADWTLYAYDASGTLVDTPLSIVNASAGLITLGGSTNRPVNLTGDCRFGGVVTITNGRIGTFSNADDASGTLRAGEAGLGRMVSSAGARAWFGYSGYNLNTAGLAGLVAESSGRMNLVGKGGAVVVVSNDGSITLQTTLNATITMGATSGLIAMGGKVDLGGLFGYSTGQGTAVTQSTSKSTAVAWATGKTVGTVTMNAAALAANTTVSFQLTCDQIDANSQVIITHSSGGTLGGYGFAVTPAAGSCSIAVRNLTSGSLSEALVLRVLVLKGVVS